MLAIAIAISVGVVMAQGKWLFGAFAIAIGCALSWPVQLGLGMFAFLVPFDFVALPGGGADATGLTWIAGVAAIALLLFKGLISRRLRIPAKSFIWWFLFILWATTTAAWVAALVQLAQLIASLR